MADWLKVNHALIRSPKLRMLMRELKCKKHTALGVALNWLIWVDEQTTDGRTNLTHAEVDEELGFRGCAKALCAIGWADADEKGLVFAVEFDKHCGETAKARAINAQRVAKCTARKKEREANAKTNASANGETNGEANAFSNAETNGKTNEKTLAEKKRIEFNIKDVSNVPNNNTVVTSGDEPPAARSGKPLPESSDEVRSFMAAQPICGLKGDDLTVCASGFFDDMESVGWTARNGAPLFDWQAAARKYLTSWQRRSLQPLGGRAKGQAPVVYRSETNPDYSL